MSAMRAMRAMKNGLTTHTNGDRCWYLNGSLHRIGGPAVELVNGSYEWYLNDIGYSFEEYIIAAEWSNEQLIMWKLLQ
jgi:hypothetical protein